jgi:hypothetical protein
MQFYCFELADPTLKFLEAVSRARGVATMSTKVYNQAGSPRPRTRNTKSSVRKMRQLQCSDEPEGARRLGKFELQAG